MLNSVIILTIATSFCVAFRTPNGNLDQIIPETDDILDLVEALQGDFPDIAFEDPFELFPAVKPMMQ